MPFYCSLVEVTKSAIKANIEIKAKIANIQYVVIKRQRPPIQDVTIQLIAVIKSVIKSPPTANMFEYGANNTHKFNTN